MSNSQSKKPKMLPDHSEQIQLATSDGGHYVEPMDQRPDRQFSLLRQLCDKAKQVFRSHSGENCPTMLVSNSNLSHSTNSKENLHSCLNVLTSDVPKDLTQLKQSYDKSSAMVKGLTLEEIGNIQQSWSLLKQQMEHIGVIFFLNLMEQHSDFRDAFAVYRGRPMVDLVRDPNVQFHGLLVLNTVDKLIDRLSDFEAFEAIIMPLGSNHCMYTPSIDLFMHATQQLYIVIKNKLEEQGEWTDDLGGLWRKLTIHLSNSMIYALSNHVHSTRLYQGNVVDNKARASTATPEGHS